MPANLFPFSLSNFSLEGTIEPFDLSIAAIAIFLAFTVQTVCGFAAGLVALPILLTSYEIAESVAILSIFQLAFSAILFTKNYTEVKREAFFELLPTTVIGVLIGSAILSYGNPQFLKTILGVFILLYIAYRYTSKRKFTITKVWAYTIGLVGGLFSGLFSSGAPPFVVYMFSKFEDPKIIRANLIGILAVTNTLRFFALISTGVLDKNSFQISLWGAPLFLLAIIFGERIFKNMNREIFTHTVMIFLAISGVLLLLR